MFVELLAAYYRATVFLNTWCEYTKGKIRTFVGPAPQNYYLCPNNRILPSTLHNVPTIPSIYLYNAFTQKITTIENQAPVGRFRPLPILSLRLEHDEYGTIDMSDWITEIRANPIPACNVKQWIELWGLTQNKFVPIDNIRIYIVYGDGREEMLEV